MRAVVQRELGPPEVLAVEQWPAPQAGAGEVLIDVEIANITFIETQLRAGHAPNPAMLRPLPSVPGNGVGGIVRAVGHGVDQALVGARVVASTGGSGAYAEQAVAQAGAVVVIPSALTMADAVALLADGRTALALMRSAGVRAGETVLVEAAGGGVGTLLVQLARAAGARVVAGASSARKLELARELGADALANYAEPGWTDGLEPLDVVFDGIGGDIAAAAFELIRPGGRMLSFGLASGAFARIDEQLAAARGVTLVRSARPTPAESAELSRRALQLAADGTLRPVVGQTFPLERAADAHAAIESRATLGKTLLVVRP
jgi:NADPH2:quinone reductase